MHFKVQKSPNEGKTKSNHILCVIVHKFSVIHDTSLLLAEILMEISQDLINGVSWSRGANKRLFKFKRLPKGEIPKLPFLCPIVLGYFMMEDSG